MFATFNNNIRIDGSKSVAKMRHHNVFAVKRIDRKKNTSNSTSNCNKLNSQRPIVVSYSFRRFIQPLVSALFSP